MSEFRVAILLEYLVLHLLEWFPKILNPSNDYLQMSEISLFIKKISNNVFWLLMYCHLLGNRMIYCKFCVYCLHVSVTSANSEL